MLTRSSASLLATLYVQYLTICPRAVNGGGARSAGSYYEEGQFQRWAENNAGEEQAEEWMEVVASDDMPTSSTCSRTLEHGRKGMPVNDGEGCGQGGAQSVSARDCTPLFFWDDHRVDGVAVVSLTACVDGVAVVSLTACVDGEAVVSLTAYVDVYLITLVTFS